MAETRTKLTTAVENYLADLRRIRASGGATDELSYYPPLSNLLNAVGGTLRPKVFCIVQLAQQGAGHPDCGLYASKQVQRGTPQEGQLPECGVVEVKSTNDNAWVTADGAQVSQYWNKYRLVLVTNTRDFVLLGEDGMGKPAKLETFQLAESATVFESKLQAPRAFADEVGVGLGEYLCRALSHRATLVEPKDLAWLLASYARDSLKRVEAAGEAPSLVTVRAALEEALGVQFEGKRGAAFFRSTLVQTLFYGVFSAWVLWSRQTPPPIGSFNWHDAVWYLRVPVLQALFQQVSSTSQLQPLGLVETLDWTATALDRVDRNAFFDRFSEGEAVPYFYEPFLQAFDPELRKQLGVWYTPPEVVRYMVSRVDRELKDELGIVDGLAAQNVYVLDPCCGTGAYLAEVLHRIAANLRDRSIGVLTGVRVKEAAAERVFGFEIMPAPFVIAHLQVGLAMQDLDAPLSKKGTERAGVFLTNALTGWEPKMERPLPFPELEEERKQADQVKQVAPVLVILGNPPYNGFAGMAVEEERELSTAYRTTKQVRSPEGQGLNDLYVRFFRMAERRIAEKTGLGVVCFISNYSWLDGLSFTGMRERYLEVFDIIRIDCLNGDKYKTGKKTPDGAPDPSIFSTPEDPVGIQIGTAITTLVRKASHTSTKTVEFRHLWGKAKREELIATAQVEPNVLYDSFEPNLALGLPFAPMVVRDGWQDWLALPDLFSKSYPGVKSGRDPFVVDIDLDRLRIRMMDYFNLNLSHEEIERRYPTAMRNPREYDARAVRDMLLKCGGPTESGFIRYAYRPFDIRWLYWEPREKLVDRPRPDYKPHVFEGNQWLVTQQKPRREWSPPQIISYTGCLDLMDRGATCIPIWLHNDGLEGDLDRVRPNLSQDAQCYLDRLGASVEDLFYYTLAVLHNPAYSKDNSGPLRMEWPRIPLPGWPDGDVSGASEELALLAARGRELAALLDTDAPVAGVTIGDLRPEIAAIAVPATIDGHNMTSDDFALTVGWGRFGTGYAVMPGQGQAVERQYTADERVALGSAADTLGDATLDIHMNDRAYWRNVPSPVWGYKLGGYQVLKKWLSYREYKVQGRPLSLEEVQHFTDAARRIVAILKIVNES